MLILVLGAVFVAANIALDILYQALDPRLRQSEPSCAPAFAGGNGLSRYSTA